MPRTQEPNLHTGHGRRLEQVPRDMPTASGFFPWSRLLVVTATSLQMASIGMWYLGELPGSRVPSDQSGEYRERRKFRH
jgi:hypothetical protein